MISRLELLNFIYKNSDMGRKTTRELIDVSTDVEFIKHLTSQLTEYEKFNKLADELIKNCKEKPEGTTTLEDITSYVMIKMNTLTDKSSTHISEMLIQGSTMGIIDLKKHLNDLNNVDSNQDVMKIANQLLVCEQKNIEELKKFL